MTRRIRQISAMAALLAILTPLCALACLEETPNEAAAASSTVPPCHQESAPESQPATPSHHEDCGCRSMMDAVVIDAGPLGDDARTQTTFAAPDLAFTLRVTDRGNAWRTPVATATDLPAPDILTLHATLLL